MTNIHKNIPLDPNGQITRLVTVPSFEKSATAIIVNLRTLECDPICFNSNSEIDEE